MGILSFQIFFVSSLTNVEISVAMYPGETALARAKPTHSTASDLPKNPESSSDNLIPRGSQILWRGEMTALTHMAHTSLSRVISRLQLRDINNMARHGRGSDEAATTIPLELPACSILARLPLPPPYPATRARAVEDAVEVVGHDLAVVLELPVRGGALRPGDTRVGYEDIEPVVEFLDLGVDGLLDLLG